MKRLSFVLGAGVLGIVGALSSAFTSAPTATKYVFWNTTGIKTVNKAAYIFRTSTVLPGCLVNANSYCKAFFTQATAPLTGQHPSATAVIHTIVTGEYNGQ